MSFKQHLPERISVKTLTTRPKIGLLRNAVVLAALALLDYAVPCAGQAIYGSINGTITDATGAAIPNAAIVITDTDKGTKTPAVSGGGGEYLIQHLVPDHYVIHVEAPGFTAEETTGVRLDADSSPRFDFSLRLAVRSRSSR